jgi:hypothetical protein
MRKLRKVKPQQSLVIRPQTSPQKALFADVKQIGLHRLWTHYSVGVRHFSKDYSLPIGLTSLLIILLIGISLIRMQQRSSLAALLADTTTVSSDYGTLNSADRSDKVTASEDTNLPTPVGTSTSITFNPSGTTTTNLGTTTPTNPGGGATPLVFGASIASFQQIDNKLECSSAKPNKPNCSKRYVFTAAVRTQNGPGSVSYGWASNLAAANEESSFSVASGDQLRTLQKEILVACLSPGTYSLRFNIFSPSQAQSTTLNFNHNCDGI